MTLDTFEKRMDKLRVSYPELIDEYEEKTGDNFDDYIQDLYILYNKLAKLRSSADPIVTVTNALSNAISANVSVIDIYNEQIARAMVGGEESGSLQQYFKEISAAYERNGNNYDIEYCPENRDKLIEMNLKTVISVAKGYQGLGLSLEELILAGNEGLTRAFDKYDPTRAKLKDDMLDSISKLADDANEEQIIECMSQYLKYGDIKKKFCKMFGVLDKSQPITEESDADDILNELEGTTSSSLKMLGWKHFSKTDVIKWIKHTVKNATFNSVAFMWIRAYIILEIDNNSRLVKKPKAEIYRDKELHGSYRREVTLDIDARVGDDGNTTFGDILNLEDDTLSDVEVSEAYDTFKDGLNKLLDGVKPRDRAVFLKKFGIGLPRPMLPKEIAEQEKLSIARISQIFQSVIEQMQKNQVKYNIDPDILFDAVRKLD